MIMKNIIPCGEASGSLGVSMKLESAFQLLIVY